MNYSYSALIFVHILLFVYWLGADLGVFYSGGFLTNANLSVDTRQTVWKILRFLDLFPRVASVMMLPVGATLALLGGYANLPTGWEAPAIGIIWVAGLSWLILVVKIYNGPRLRLSQVDLAIRYTLIAALIAVGSASLMGKGPIVAGVTWLPLKMFIFAGILACGLRIRTTFKSFVITYRKLVSEGSTPAIEAAMKQAQARVRPVVITLWIGVAAEAFLGVSKL